MTKEMQQVLSLLECSPAEWDEQLSGLDFNQIRGLESAADDLCQLAAKLSGYLTYRAKNYYNTHEKALKEGDAVLKAVRKALGYTNP